MCYGNIHSVETFGAVDGPGIRFIVFTAGCPLRCLYCHNPDARTAKGSRRISADDMAKEIEDYMPYIRNGGVTVSGGEPLLQPKFVAALLKKCTAMGLHTAIDTSAAVKLVDCREAVDAAKLLLLDIKSLDPELCVELTGSNGHGALAMLDHCEAEGKSVWIRHVVVPGYTLNFEKLFELGKYLSKYSCVERVDLLPFHKLGEEKWKRLNLDYKLYETQPPTQQQMEFARQALDEGLAYG